MTPSIVRILAFAALLTAPALAHAQGAVASSPPLVPMLVTSGQGEAKVTPDRASLLINVQTRAATAAAAGATNARRTDAVLDALARLGLPKSQLSTQGYSVAPEMQYNKEGGPPRVIGYVVTNSIRAETKQPEQVGQMIDAALGAGANVINSLSFYASSLEAPRREAIAKAVASARADAEAMANAAGGSLGGLIELSTQGPVTPPRPMFEFQQMRAAGQDATAETRVNPGEQSVSVYVSARWLFVGGGR